MNGGEGKLMDSKYTTEILEETEILEDKIWNRFASSLENS